MQKKPQKRIALSTETVRALQADRLREIAGAASGGSTCYSGLTCKDCTGPGTI